MLAIVVSLLVPLAFGFRESDRRIIIGSGGQTIAAALAEARTHSGCWLLNAGFFVCGFHVRSSLPTSRVPRG